MVSNKGPQQSSLSLSTQRRGDLNLSLAIQDSSECNPPPPACICDSQCWGLSYTSHVYVDTEPSAKELGTDAFKFKLLYNLYLLGSSCWCRGKVLGWAHGPMCPRSQTPDSSLATSQESCFLQKAPCWSCRCDWGFSKAIPTATCHL